MPCGGPRNPVAQPHLTGACETPSLYIYNTEIVQYCMCTMAWFTCTIDTVDIADTEATETDHVWRQIDPEIYYLLKQTTD